MSTHMFFWFPSFSIYFFEIGVMLRTATNFSISEENVKGELNFYRGT